MVYRWYYRRHSLRYCIGYRVLNKVYIYIHKPGLQGVFFQVLPLVLYIEFFKVYKGGIL